MPAGQAKGARVLDGVGEVVEVAEEVEVTEGVGVSVFVRDGDWEGVAEGSPKVSTRTLGVVRSTTYSAPEGPKAMLVGS